MPRRRTPPSDSQGRATRRRAAQGILPLGTNGQQLDVSQVGVGNSSTSTQSGNSQSASVAQSGDGNVSEINQNGNAGLAEATVTQAGDQNSSTVFQGSNGVTTGNDHADGQQQ